MGAEVVGGCALRQKERHESEITAAHGGGRRRRFIRCSSSSISCRRPFRGKTIRFVVDRWPAEDIDQEKNPAVTPKAKELLSFLITKSKK